MEHDMKLEEVFESTDVQSLHKQFRKMLQNASAGEVLLFKNAKHNPMKWRIERWVESPSGE